MPPPHSGGSCQLACTGAVRETTAAGGWHRSAGAGGEASLSTCCAMQSVQVNRYNLRHALYPTNPAHDRALNKCTAMFRTHGDKERSGVVTNCGAVALLIVGLDPC
jgi:hypothetical protein